MVGIVPRIRNLGILWRLSASILAPLFFGIVPNTHVWAPQLLWWFWRRKKSVTTTGDRTKIRCLPRFRRLVTGISPRNAEFHCQASPAQWWLQRDSKSVCSQYFLCLLSLGFYRCPILIHSFVCYRRYMILTTTHVVKVQLKQQNHDSSFVYCIAQPLYRDMTESSK